MSGLLFPEVGIPPGLPPLAGPSFWGYFLGRSGQNLNFKFNLNYILSKVKSRISTAPLQAVGSAACAASFEAAI